MKRTGLALAAGAGSFKPCCLFKVVFFVLFCAFLVAALLLLLMLLMLLMVWWVVRCYRIQSLRK